MTQEEAQDMLRMCARELTEFFDTIQIVGTWEDGDDTHFATSGSGNFFARKESAREFLEQDDAQILAEEIADSIDPPDEADTWKNDENT